MKKLLIVFDEETASLLEAYPNKSEIIRQATKLYIEHISTDTVEGMRASYKIINKQLREVDSKLDYIARLLTDHN